MTGAAETDPDLWWRAVVDAVAEVRAAADRVTGRNVDDGVAVVVEELLAARATGRGEPTARV